MVELQRRTQDAFLAAIEYARSANERAARAEMLASSGAVTLRDVGAPVGFSVESRDGKVSATRDPNVAQTLEEGRALFHRLAFQAARRLEELTTAGVIRLLRERGRCWTR